MKSYISKFLLIALLMMPASLMAQADTATIAPAAAEAVAPVAEAVAEEAESPIIPLDTVWVLIAAMLVFFMQPGFALVEAGMTRTKNTANILMKNFMDFSAGSVLYWALGFSIMFGVGGFLGWNGFGISEVENPCANLPKECYFIFQTVFCATAATIVSGAMAERTKFSMYLVYSLLISAFVYPIQGHWSWGGGWLSEMGFHDFAGSAVVHSCGGFLALAGAIVLGPRMGKYTKMKDGKIRSNAIPGHSLTLAALGVWILWFGWFGFNPGSTVAATGSVEAGYYGGGILENMSAMSHIFVTTNIAAAVGALTALVYTWIAYGKPSLSMVCNGILAGLVGITAGCDCVPIWAAAIIGMVASVVMCFAVNFLDTKLHIDDPVGAVSVHGMAGFTGTILTGVFAYSECGYSVLTQLIGEVAIAGWSFVCGLIIFTLIKKIHGLRVESRIEEEGLDVYEHGEAAYN
ncbi:MAG: ammonium transporter [Paludibacteraceae bacterium]|nr:ammonium transporter [Paludibacteraceae bacterium]